MHGVQEPHPFRHKKTPTDSYKHPELLTCVNSHSLKNHKVLQTITFTTMHNDMINKHFRETVVLETQNISEEVQHRKVSGP